MVSGTTWVAIGLIVALIAIGVSQHLDLPKSNFAGAVTAQQNPPPQTQEQINGCMQKCMNLCVTTPGSEDGCNKICDGKCIPKNT